MKKKELIRQLRLIARAGGLDSSYSGGTKHEKWILGLLTLVIPRHIELKEMTAQAILKSAKSEVADNGRKDPK